MTTSLDNLHCEGGYPSVESFEKLYDQLDAQRVAVKEDEAKVRLLMARQ
jgi:hypothetical protein